MTDLVEPARPSYGKSIPIKQLFLDPKNPRLVVGPSASEDELIRLLYASESLDELAPSFVENGYFAEEPIVVVPDGEDRWIAVEGNRRLATLKLLHSASLRQKLGVSDWPVLTAEQSARLAVIPCVVYQERDEVLPFLGFRHITGAKKWAPFQKARFIAQLIESGRELTEVEDLIGDTGQTVKKLYQDYVVFNQVTEDLQIAEKPLRDRFSLLEVTLGQRNIKAHLGMPRRLPDEATTQLVPDDKLDELEEVMGWVFGTPDRPAVIDDSREIASRLAPVIGNEVSLARLRANGDLEAAYDFSGGEKDYLMKKISATERALREVSSLVAVHNTDADVLAGLERVFALAEGVKRLADV